MVFRQRGMIPPGTKYLYNKGPHPITIRIETLDGDTIRRTTVGAGEISLIHELDRDHVAKMEKDDAGTFQ